MFYTTYYMPYYTQCIFILAYCHAIMDGLLPVSQVEDKESWRWNDGEEVWYNSHLVWEWRTQKITRKILLS